MMSSRACALLLLSAIAGASDSETPDDPTPPSWKASLEDQVAHDSNPQLGLKRYAPANQFQPDWFNDAVGSASYEDPSIPLRARARVIDEAYFRDHAVDTTITRGSLGAPLALDTDDQLTPEYQREDQWYDGHYFQAASRGSVDWTRSWSATFETDLRPYYSELTHPTIYHSQDGYEYGVEATLSMLAPTGRWLREIDLGMIPERYDAARAYFGYHQLEVFSALEWALPQRLRLLLDASVAPTVYNEPEPGKKHARRDRTVACDVNLSRELIGPIRIEAVCELTRDRSSLRTYSFDEIIVGAGLKAMLP